MTTIAVLFSAIPATLIAPILAVLRRGIAREDSDQSLRTEPPTRTCAITRRMTGLYADPQDDSARLARTLL